MTKHSFFMRRAAVRSVGALMAAVLVLGMVAYTPPAPDTVDLGPVQLAATAQTCGTGTAKVLILAETQQFWGACNHPTVTAANALGFAADIATDSEWGAMSAADFGAYRAVIMGDSACSGGTDQVDAAEANAATWSSAVDGNVLVIGTDESYHTGDRGEVLTQKGVGFATSDATKTGAYISLSCYYHYFEPAATPTTVDVLSGFGTFKALQTSAISGPSNDCYNDIHIVATHPALDGLTDANLEGWGCSVHEAFSQWPLSFEVLTIAENIGTEFFTAPDGTSGAPYILARGVQVISDITLSPDGVTKEVGQSQTLTAHVEEDDAPLAGKTVRFSVVDGPHNGLTGTGITNGSGDATFSYTGSSLGTDTIEATFVDSAERTQRSNRVTLTWVGEVFDPCSDAGIWTDPTLGQVFWEWNYPLMQDPDADGPVSGQIEAMRGEAPNSLVDSALHDGACLANAPFLDL